MNLQITTLGNFTIVMPQGRVDITNSIEFEMKMTEAAEGEGIKIILDCSELSYISSSGLRVLLVVRKKITSLNGQFRLCNLQPLLKEIFDISGFSSIFPVFLNREDAIREL